MNTSYSPTRITGRRFMLPDAVRSPKRGSRRFVPLSEEVGEASRTSIEIAVQSVDFRQHLGALAEAVGIGQRDFGALRPSGLCQAALNELAAELI